MSAFNEQLLVAIKNHSVSNYPSMEQLVDKHQITFFNILSASMIGKIDSEITVNQNVTNEALTLMETAQNLSFFYNSGNDSFLDKLVQTIVLLRERREFAETCLQESIMREYFMSEGSIAKFLSVNPVYLGVYIYLLANV